MNLETAKYSARRPSIAKIFRGIDNEGIWRDGEDRGDGIGGKNDVRAFDRNEHDEERRRPELAVFAHKKLIPLVALDNGEEAPETANRPVFFRVVFLLFLAHHREAREEQEGAEDVDRPMKALHQRETADDEHHAQDDRADNAPEEHLVLIAGGTWK
jgi:hypothetical protein